MATPAAPSPTTSASTVEPIDAHRALAVCSSRARTARAAASTPLATSSTDHAPSGANAPDERNDDHLVPAAASAIAPVDSPVASASSAGRGRAVRGTSLAHSIAASMRTSSVQVCDDGAGARVHGNYGKRFAIQSATMAIASGRWPSK